MFEWIVTSSVLILIITALRFFLKGRLSPHIQYGLWLLVLLRLLIPFSVDSSVSVMNLIPNLRQSEVTNVDSSPKPIVMTVPTEYFTVPIGQQMIPDEQVYIQDSLQPDNKQIPANVPIQTEQVLLLIWIFGIIVVAATLIGCNLHFFLRLKRCRQMDKTAKSRIPVYVTSCVRTPCLFGLARPCIYLPSAITDMQGKKHILMHEMVHYKHHDHIWSALRCVCLVLHWYNPLVWIAVVLSKQDAELSCDATTVNRLGESERLSYGKTLIESAKMRGGAAGYLIFATGIYTSRKFLKERILMIAKKPKTAVITLIAVILTAVLAVGCTFTGASRESKADLPTTAGVEEQTEGTMQFAGEQKVYVRENGGFGSDFTVTLFENGEFKYYEGNFSSYVGYGQWSLNGNILTVEDSKFTNLFRVDDNALVWVADGSSGFTYGSHMSMADGDRFLLQEAEPQELQNMLELSYLPQDYMDGGPLGCFVNIDGTTYVWDHCVVGNLDGLFAAEIGTVSHCDDTQLPLKHMYSCRIPEGTVLYKGKDAGKSKYEAVYYKLENQPHYAHMLPVEAYRGQDRWWERQIIYDGKNELTIDTLRSISKEKGALLSRADLAQYGYMKFSGPSPMDYRLFCVDDNYRLLLVSAATVTDIEAIQARFYHKDSPNYWIDIMTTSLDLFNQPN